MCLVSTVTAEVAVKRPTLGVREGCTARTCLVGGPILHPGPSVEDAADCASVPTLALFLAGRSSLPREIDMLSDIRGTGIEGSGKFLFAGRCCVSFAVTADEMTTVEVVVRGPSSDGDERTRLRTARLPVELLTTRSRIPEFAELALFAELRAMARSVA
ncbi:hypothetical protein BKA93DRAFT_86505 [Sparassis latifolia]